MGYKICASGNIPEKTNTLLANKINEIREADIYDYKLIYVSYNDGLGYHAGEVLDRELEQIRGTGNRISFEIYNKTRMADIYYLKNKKVRKFDIELKQLATGTGYLSSDDINCYSIYVGLDQLADICKDYKDILFEENVRLFHGITNPYNQEIKNTAIDGSNNFHLYNNGIVILSDKIKYNDMSKIMKISNPKVVNGCQTMNSLLAAKEEKDILEGCVGVRIIEIKDPVISQNISIYLNSQTEIKDSYLISNLPIILNLKEELQSKGYFLERQANQIDNLKQTLTKNELEKLLGKAESRVIKLEDAIQVYATFYEKMGPVAKLNKAKLFNNKKNLEVILKNISAEKVIVSYKAYRIICEVITDFRRYRRNKNKNEILEYLSISNEVADQYIFMNTADIFILGLVAELIQKKLAMDKENISNTVLVDLELQENIREYIKIACKVINNEILADKTGKSPATLTKSANFYRTLVSKVIVE